MKSAIVVLVSLLSLSSTVVASPVPVGGLSIRADTGTPDSDAAKAPVEDSGESADFKGRKPPKGKPTGGAAGGAETLFKGRLHGRSPRRGKNPNKAPSTPPTTDTTTPPTTDSKDPTVVANFRGRIS